MQENNRGVYYNKSRDVLSGNASLLSIADDLDKTLLIFCFFANPFLSGLTCHFFYHTHGDNYRLLP